MSRTPLFATIEKLLALFHDAGIERPQSAAAAGTAVPSPASDSSAYAKKKQPKKPVAIIGGGVAGLTAAYRLYKAGRTPIVFEASNRWGGRMFTVYNFYEGMFCELGGELVDTNHKDLRELLAEFSLETQKLHCRDERRAALQFAVALGTNSVSANQGNSIVPLYLPPDSMSVSSSKV